MTDESLESTVQSLTQTLDKKSNFEKRTNIADVFSSMTYSLIVGSGFDYVNNLRTFAELGLSRIINVSFSGATASWYGKARDALYTVTKTTTHSSYARKMGVEMGVNLVYAPMYGLFSGAIKLGKYYVEHHVLNAESLDVAWDAMQAGAASLVYWTPFFAITQSFYSNFIRKVFGVKTPAEKSENYIESHAKEK